MVVGCSGLLGIFRSKFGMFGSKRSPVRKRTFPWWWVRWFAWAFFRSKFGVPANARSDEQRLGRAMVNVAPIRQVGEVRAPARAGERPFR